MLHPIIRILLFASHGSKENKDATNLILGNMLLLIEPKKEKKKLS
jgi:hypothetical protein